VGGYPVNLIKIRNPHGSKGREWMGEWGDADRRWDQVSNADKQRIGYVMNEKDSTFWMEFECWLDAVF